MISKKQKEEEKIIKSEESAMDCSDGSKTDEEMNEVYLPASPIEIQDSSDESPPPLRKKRRIILESDDDETDGELTPKVCFP